MLQANEALRGIGEVPGSRQDAPDSEARRRTPRLAARNAKAPRLKGFSGRVAAEEIIQLQMSGHLGGAASERGLTRNRGSSRLARRCSRLRSSRKNAPPCYAPCESSSTRVLPWPKRSRRDYQAPDEWTFRRCCKLTKPLRNRGSSRLAPRCPRLRSSRKDAPPCNAQCESSSTQGPLRPRRSRRVYPDPKKWIRRRCWQLTKP